MLLTALVLVTPVSPVAAPAAEKRSDSGRSVAGGLVEGSAFTEAGESSSVLPDLVVEAGNQAERDIQQPTFELQPGVAVVESFLSVVAESESFAGRRAERIATFLAEAMILPRERIETEAVQRADLRAEMDGAVMILIEHVR